MKTYVLTIIDLKTNTIQHLTRNNQNIDQTVQKKLGGWSNLINASTSNRSLDDINAQSCGTTKDNSKMYSILAYSNIQ